MKNNGIYGSHMEEKYNRVEQILIWTRRYTREQLELMNLPEIRRIYAKIEFGILGSL